MTRVATRSSLHRSPFVRILAELGAVDGDASRDAFAEKLAQWIPIADAIALRAAHTPPTAAANPAPSQAKAQARPAKAAAGPDAGAAVEPAAAVAADPVAAVQAQYQRVRSTLEQALQTPADAPPAKAAATRSGLPALKRGAPVELAGAFEPYRRYYVAQQRDMELKLKPLRAHAREALQTATPALRQLAALDAALDGFLAEREGMLLATVPQLLEKRFKQLRQAHQDSLADGQEDTTDAWMQPGGWLARFRTELQTLLQAELEMRLQPIAGLLQALGTTTPHPA